MNMLYILCK